MVFGMEDGAKQSFNVDECFDIEKFADLAPVLINDCSLLYYTLLKNPQFDGKMNQVLQKIQQLNGRTEKGFLRSLMGCVIRKVSFS